MPDVAGFAAVVREHATRRRIREVVVRDAAVIHRASGRGFAESCTGTTVRTPRQHGKWLFVPLHGRGSGDPVIAMHFGMTGRLTWTAGGAEPHRHDRIVFVMANGELRYQDMRKLKGFTLTDRAGIDRIVAGLGPDARDISSADLRAALHSRSRQIKASLTDQALIAGLGNLLADEILWRARIDPRRRTDRLTGPDVRRLRTRMISTLRMSVRAGRIPDRPSWLTGHRDDDPGRCPRCGADLEHYRIGGRATVSCPRCQPREPDDTE